MKRLLSCFLIFLHTLANARVLVPVEEIPAAKAGVQAVAASTVVGTLNHQGNVFKAVEDLGKPESLRSIATSILTAGLVENVTQTLKLPDAPKTFGEHFQKAAIKGAVSLPVNATFGGVDPDKALGMAAISTAANTIGGFAATKIGQAYGSESLSYAEHKALHGFVGAATGAILDPKNPGRGALAGALGGITSEMLAEAIAGNPKEMATRVLGEVAERAAKEGRNFSKTEYETALKEAADVAKNIGQIGAAGTALLAKQDVGTAIHTAQTATENNLVPGLIAGGLVVWSAYDLYQTAQTEGPEAALQQAGVEVMLAVVGGTAIKQGFKIAGKLYPTAKAAWFAYVAENPIMAKIGDAVASAVERGKTWVGMGEKIPYKYYRHPDGSVWLEGPVTRGEKIEQALGQNLHKNYPVIDKFNNGVVTSIKSIDLNAKTYQDSKKLQRTLEKYVDKVADFRGDRFARKDISLEEIRLRALDLAIPHAGNPAQQQILKNLIDYGKLKDVTVNSIIFQ